MWPHAGSSGARHGPSQSIGGRTPYGVVEHVNATTCGPVQAFDESRLPFQWLPGLPVPDRGESMEFYKQAERLEVVHMHDGVVGPLWLYGAVGSGTWWRPERRLVVRNVVDAVLRFNSLETVVAHFLRKERSKGFATTRDHTKRWRAAFHNASWQTILTGAAENRDCYGLFSMAVKLFMGLPPLPTAWHGTFMHRWRQVMRTNHSLDSMIFVEAMNLWPRPLDSERRQFAEAVEVVEECRNGKQRARLHHVPEMIDFRYLGPSATKLLTSATVSSDAEGKQSCKIGDAATAYDCSHCSPERYVLCRCAKLHSRRELRHRCCSAGMEQVRRGAKQIQLGTEPANGGRTARGAQGRGG